MIDENKREWVNKFSRAIDTKENKIALKQSRGQDVTLDKAELAGLISKREQLRLELGYTPYAGG